MRRKSAFILFISILIFSVVLSGCQTNRQIDQNTQPEVSNSPQPTQQPQEGQDALPQEVKVDNSGEMIPDVAALAELFPKTEGYKWIYNGFAEYGHEMTLNEIVATQDKVVYTMKGEVFDMSDGESQNDFSLSVNYTITADSVVQDKVGPMMFDVYDHIELIRTPLEVGESWNQTVKSADGKEVNLKCTIEKVEMDGTAKVYTIVYQDTNSPFYERRVIKEGIGVIAFSRLYINEEQNFEITYSLYEEASGYDK